jgi:hypothetical protein
MTDVVEIIRDLTPQIVEVIQDLEPTVIEVLARGPQGPQGPAGPSGSADIGGYPVQMIGEAENNDVLSFGSDIMAWYNRKQETLTDGGNF